MPDSTFQIRLVAALTQSIAYWLLAVLLRDQPVSALGWVALYGICALVTQTSVASAANHVYAPASPLAAVNSGIAAALLWGADAGRKLIDAGYAEHADRYAMPGGLEVWWLLCPGMTSILLALYASRLCRNLSAVPSYGVQEKASR